MALPAAGVRLVAEDANKFDSALKTAGSVLDGFGKTASSVASSVNAAFSGMASAVGNALRPLGKLFEQIFVSVIRSVVNDAIHQLERFASAVIQAAIEGSDLEKSIARLGATFDSVSKVAFWGFTMRLNELVERVAPVLGGVALEAGIQLSNLGVNALTWGENFINQFAQGMWNAVGAIIQVLTEIANMISYWLSPGSPPRILPDLDQWGTDAANEFFGGWLQADFGIFNDLSSTLTGLIRSLAPSGPQGGIDVVSRILGTRQSIAAAVEELRTTGTVATTTIDAITAAVGSSDASVRAYLESMVRLQAANETVRQAQEELNRVTEEYEALLRPINEEIAGITEEQQQLVDEQKKSLLQLVLQDPNATASEKRQAQLEIERLDAEKRRRALLAEQAVAVDAAQENLDTAKSAQELAQEEFDARQAQIAAQTEQNNLLREQIRLMEQLNRILGGGAEAGPKPPKLGGAGAIKPKPFAITPFNLEDFIPPDVMAKLQEFLTAFQALWANVIAVLQPAIDVWDNLVVPAWNRLVAAFTTSVPAILTAVSQIVAFTIQLFGLTLVPVLTNVASAIDSLTQIWTNHGKTILAIVVVAYKIISAIIAAVLIIISGVFADTLNRIAGTFDVWSAAFKGDWKGAWKAIQDTVTKSVSIWETTFTGALSVILAAFGLTMDDLKPIFQTLKTWLDTTLTSAITVLSAAWTATLKPAIEAVWKWMKDPLFPFLTSISNLVGAVFGLAVRTLAAAWKDTLQPAMTGVHKFMNESLLPVLKDIEKFIRETFTPIFNSLGAAIWVVIGGPFTALLTILANINTAMRDLTTFINGLADLINGIPSLPPISIPGPGSSGGMSNGPPPTNTSGSPVYNSSSQGPTYNYSPTYQGAPPSPQHDFTIMQVFS